MTKNHFRKKQKYKIIIWRGGGDQVLVKIQIFKIYLDVLLYFYIAQKVGRLAQKVGRLAQIVGRLAQIVGRLAQKVGRLAQKVGRGAL